MTKAEKIAEKLGNDGQTWMDDDGVSLDKLCTSADGDITARQKGHGILVRYQFSDGSAIVAGGRRLGHRRHETL